MPIDLTFESDWTINKFIKWQRYLQIAEQEALTAGEKARIIEEDLRLLVAGNKVLLRRGRVLAD